MKRFLFQLVLWTWLVGCRGLASGDYVERISSFETEAEAQWFTYYAEGKGWAKVTDERASHGKKSLEVEFLITEAEAFGEEGFYRHFLRYLGIPAEGPKLALLGRSKGALPFDWTGVDAFAFDAYNPSAEPVELSLKVSSGLYDYDPTEKLYHTQVTLSPRQWTAVRLLPKMMGDDLHSAGVIYVRLDLPDQGTLFIDNVRFESAAGPRAETKYVRLTWTDDPRSTQTITWQSRAETGLVRFGLNGEDLKHKVTSQSTRAFCWGPGVFHEVVLRGLRADSTYDYQVRSGEGAWTPKKSFRTAPASDEAVFTFLAGSDTKFQRQTTIKLLELFEKDNPRFMLYAGDAPHTGGVPSQWSRWFQAVESFASQRPIMQSTGNHEVGGDPQLVNFRIFNALPARPGHEVYYSFDYGPVHVVCLDTDSGLYPEQVPWVELDLAATKKPWKVAFFHRPLFSSGTVHGSDEELRKVLGPIFGKHHVTLVISGHDHLYERSKPINLWLSKNTPVSSYKEGTCYVVSGGAGAGLYDAKRGNWWTHVVKTRIHHICRIKVNGSKSMILEAVDQEGHVFDTVLLEN